MILTLPFKVSELLNVKISLLMLFTEKSLKDSLELFGPS